MNLYYAEEINEESGFLGQDESHHAIRVMRLDSGDELLVTKGEGKIFRARTGLASKKRVEFHLLDIFREESLDRKLSIAMAPTKANDRFENFLEKATELGIRKIIPIFCSHSERKVYKVERGRKLIQAAAKQSLSCWWPHLEESTTFEALIKQYTESDIPRYIAYCEEVERFNLLPQLKTFSDCLVLIGPEGDFTEAEVTKAKAAGFKVASLGKQRLRTETAGIAVSVAFNLEH